MATPEILNSNLDIAPVKEAVALLSRVPRPKQEDVQPLQSKWGVARLKEGKRRPLAEVIGEVEQRVVNATQELQAQLANNAGKLATVVPTSAAQPDATCSASAEQPASSSAVQPVVAHRTKTACLFPGGVISTENNAEQPGAEHGQSGRLPPIVTIDDCKSWCDSLAEAAPRVKYISDAIAVLQEPNARERRSQLQRLCKPWAVEQYHAQKKKTAFANRG
jgi:hypothetical protein